MIYLDNAATTMKKPETVEKAVVNALRTFGNAGRGAHGSTLDASRTVYAARAALARLFHVPDPSRIAFTMNATESLNIAINGLFSPGDHVVSTVLEHNSVLRPLYLLETQGVRVDYIGADSFGILDYEAMDAAVTEDTKAVIVTHASNLTGNITDLGRISKICRNHHALLIVDAAQTAGTVPINVEEMGIDVLCFTGHKGLFGPQGTGGIYVRDGLMIRPLKVGGSGIKSFEKLHPQDMPTALEAGTLNTHGIAGLLAAVEYIETTGVERIRAHEQALLSQFVEGISGIDGIRLYGNPDFNMRAGIVSFNVRDIDSALFSDWLWEDYEICVRPGAHCAPKMHETFHTVEQGAVRVSFSFFNTEEEVETAVRALRELAR